jgi:DNA polymerase-3 subunit delta'
MPLANPAPTLFEDIRGAWKRDRLAQAYVLTGAVRGSALDLARRILAMLFCQAERDQPCGSCPGCRQAAEDRLPDVRFLEPVKASQKIGVEETRGLCSALGQTSLAGGWKAGVLLYADRMTSEAANAFLKMLEEPPPRTLFLLLTEQPSGLLPTVLSRCQKVVLPAGDEAIRPWMETVAGLMADKGLGALAGLGAATAFGAILGNMREEVETAETEAWDAGGAEDDDDKLKARITARYKESRAVALRALLLWQRDVLAGAAGAGPELWVYRDYEAAVRDQAGRTPVAKALARVEAVEEMQTQLDQNVNETQVLEAGFSRLVF